MKIDIVTFREQMAETLNRVRYQGERVVVTRHGKPAAALVPIEDLALLEKIEDEADVKAARAALREAGEIPWEQVKGELGLGRSGGAADAGRPKRSGGRAKAGK